MRFLRPGRNCWRIARARRAAVLIDGQDYFRCLEQALEKAERSIFILGWDFDASIKLRGEADESCPKLGEFIRSLVESRAMLGINHPAAFDQGRVVRVGRRGHVVAKGPGDRAGH